MIDSFRGQYAAFSSFYRHIVRFGGRDWLGNEWAFQAWKNTDPEYQALVLRAETPGQAKALGNAVTLRDDWEEIKLPLMTILNRRKFSHQPLGELLLSTQSEILIEGNRHNDTTWGCVWRPATLPLRGPSDPLYGMPAYKKENDSGWWVGNNLLGQVLMAIRQELQLEHG